MLFLSKEGWFPSPRKEWFLFPRLNSYHFFLLPLCTWFDSLKGGKLHCTYPPSLSSTTTKIPTLLTIIILLFIFPFCISALQITTVCSFPWHPYCPPLHSFCQVYYSHLHQLMSHLFLKTQLKTHFSNQAFSSPLTSLREPA